jgi:hypothetical protein
MHDCLSAKESGTETNKLRRCDLLQNRFNAEDKKTAPAKISLLYAKAGGQEEKCACSSDYKEEVAIDGLVMRR